MKILHLRASNFYGGPERQLHFHARLTRGTDIEITVASFSESGQTPEFLEVIASDGIPIHTFKVTSGYDRSAIRTLRAYLLTNKFDILCTHDYRTHAIGWLATRSEPIGWIAFSRGWTKENLKVKLFHTLDKGIIRFADQIVAVSKAQQKKLERLLVSEGKITVAYNSIDQATFDAVEPQDIRQFYNIPADTIVGVAGGRFSPEKGQADLIEAAHIACPEEPRLRLILFGDGPDRERLKSRITTLGLNDRVHCPGHVKELPSFIKAADFLVNPSHSEGLPNIVLEGMALGVPVLATAVGGVPELVKDGVDGILMPPGDPTALADSMLSLTSGKTDRDLLTANAKQTIADRFSFEHQLEVLTGVYKKTAHQYHSRRS